MRAVLLLLLAAALPAAAQPLSARDRATPSAFTQAVAAQIRAAYPGQRVTVPSPLTLRLGNIRANLDRLHDFCRRNAEECDAEVGTYVTGLGELLRPAGAPAETIAASQLRLILRPDATLQELRRAAGGRPDAAPVSRPFLPGLHAILAIDHPSTARMAKQADLRALGLTEEAALAAARANLAQAQPPLDEKVLVAGHAIGLVAGDHYASSRLLDPAGFADLAKSFGGALVVGVPSAEAIIVGRGTTPEEVAFVRGALEHLARTATRPISGELFRWSPEGFKVEPR